MFGIRSHFVQTALFSLLLMFALFIGACGAPAPVAQESESESTTVDKRETADEETTSEEATVAETEETSVADDASEAEEMATEETAIEEMADEETSSSDLDELKQAAAATYADIVFANYQDALDLTVSLQTAIGAFVAAPSEESLQVAKDAWLAAREVYGQSEAFRFYGGPIDDEDGPEGLINAWPLDEAYIDYVEGDASTGIINDVENYPEIDAELLASLNEVGAEENISTGYHAIEFLLWGQDLSDETAGQRPYTDFVEGGTAENQARRAQYLTVVTQQLVDDLTSLVEAWDPSVEDNYRTTFLSSEVDEPLHAMLTGIGVLSKSELAGERMFTAYDNRDQEDEHSCFSDNTHRDIIANAQGIANVYTGTYTRPDGSAVEGTALADVVAVIDSDLNDEVLALLEQSLAKVNEIPIPFDQAIIESESRNVVLDAVFVLQDQGDKFAQAAGAIGIVIDTALPE